MDKLRMQTANKADENFRALAAMFPNAVTETIDENGEVVRAIDKDVLMQEISVKVIEGKDERYQFTWPDKKKSVLLANAPISKTLRPCREESVDFDTTENLYIEGDNLEVLKLLQETYLGKIKMIYIDPPYNTGNDFVYEDDFAQSADEYLVNSGQFDDAGNRLVANTESNGRFHTDWLNMMYTRLKISKDLLTENGVIFISIDSNEYCNMQKICDEIFGNRNYITTFIWHNNKKGRQMDKFIKTTNEFILLYAKNIDQVNIISKKVEAELSNYPYQDEISAYKKGYPLHNGTAAFHIYNRPNLCYTIYYSPDKKEAICIDEKMKSGDEWTLPISDRGQTLLSQGYVRILPKRNEKYNNQRVWRWGQEKFNREYQTELMFLKEDDGWYIYQKDRVDGEGLVEQKYTNYIDVDTARGKNDINKLFENKVVFDFSKPVDVIKFLIPIVIERAENAIILDFFSGSSTTAQAVMQLNADDGGNRKFIMVQLPEYTDSKTEAFKAGYLNICDIGKERIRRAGKKIKEESPMTTAELDVGFRVLKCDTSNMKEVFYKPDEVEQTLFDSYANNIKEDRNSEDLLFQIMLDLGVLLSSKIEETTIAECKVFNVAEGFLYACFDENISDEVIKAIANEQPYYAVFRDSGMASDSVLTNFDQIFASISPSTVRKVL